MSSRFLNPAVAPANARKFEIHLNEDHLVLRGTHDEANSVLLSGKLILTTTEPLKALDIRLRFTGELRKGYYHATATREHHMKDEKEFFKHQWTFLSDARGRTEILQPGDHEWPFELVLPGDTAESVEGLYDSWIIYRMKATIDRGKLAKDLHARKLVRVVRTFDTNALELSHQMTVENNWPGKLIYNISTPRKGVVFGSRFPVDFELTPLLKGLKFGRLKCTLIQTVELDLWQDAGPRARNHVYETECAKEVWTVSPDQETEDINGMEGYRLRGFMRVPTSLQKCTQSVSEMGIRVKHQLKLNILMHNPDGHNSELRATLPLHIFIAPNLRLNDTHSLVTPPPDELSEEDALAPPPGYGDHQLDQLFNEVDPSGYMTPTNGTSGVGTPSMSRRPSAEAINLGSVVDDEASANALRNRLSALQNPVSSRFLNTRGRAGAESRQAILSSVNGSPMASPSERDSPGSGDYFTPATGGSSPGNDEPLSPSVQVPVIIQPFEHIDFSPEALARVPSYNTAVHTPTSSSHLGLPTYQIATSREASPVRGESSQRHGRGQSSWTRSLFRGASS